MIDSVVELPDSDRTRRRVAINAHGRGQVELLLVHAQDFGSRLAEEEVDMFELMDQAQAFLQEMAGSRERPSPARRLAFDHLAAGGLLSARVYDFRKYRAPQPFRESHAIAWRREPGASPARFEIAREHGVHDSARDEVGGADGRGVETAMLDEHQAPC